MKQKTIPSRWASAHRCGFARTSSRVLALVVLSTTALAAACDSDDPSAPRAAQDLDLTRFGVERIVPDAGGYLLFDLEGQQIGRVDVDADGESTSSSLVVAHAEHVLEVGWTADATYALCDDGPVMTQALTSPVHDASSGSVLRSPDADVVDDASSIHGCADALAIATAVAHADNLVVNSSADTALAGDVRFRDYLPEVVVGLCESVSTWVFGSSCDSCYGAASDAIGGGRRFAGGSCSSGAVYSTCTGQFCSW